MAGIKLSTGLRNHLLKGGSFVTAFQTAQPTAQHVTGGAVTSYACSKILIFGGTVPSGPDDAATGATLLAVVANHTGSVSRSAATDWDLCFDEAGVTSGQMAKVTGDTWDGEIIATGTATFFRVIGSGDDGTSASTTAKRIQGEISTDGLSPGTLSVTSLTDNNSNRQQVEYFYMTVGAGG